MAVARTGEWNWCAWTVDRYVCEEAIKFYLGSGSNADLAISLAYPASRFRAKSRATVDGCTLTGSPDIRIAAFARLDRLFQRKRSFIDALSPRARRGDDSVHSHRRWTAASKGMRVVAMLSSATRSSPVQHPAALALRCHGLLQEELERFRDLLFHAGFFRYGPERWFPACARHVAASHFLHNRPDRGRYLPVL